MDSSTPPPNVAVQAEMIRQRCFDCGKNQSLSSSEEGEVLGVEAMEKKRGSKKREKNKILAEKALEPLNGKET